MKGSAQTSAAITITNALPTGVGCAVGIDLRAEAMVEVSPDGSKNPPTLQIPLDRRTPLVEEALRAGLVRYFPGTGGIACLTLDSAVPVARGLKSSSAVSAAILLAVARAAGRAPSSLEVALLSAQASRGAGVSATGALDDALAGLESGFVVTDNVRAKVLRRAEVDPDWGVVLYIPPETHPPSPNLAAAFSREREAGERSASAAMSGDWVTAMRVNSELVERAMGYAYGEIRDRLRSHGAIASGVSGVGPTLAAVAPWQLLPDLLEVFPSDRAQRFAVRFTQTTVTEGGRT